VRLSPAVFPFSAKLCNISRSLINFSWSFSLLHSTLLQSVYINSKQ
jgi:hypothetical protein